MANNDRQNGGGYGNTGEDRASPQRADAQMATDLETDGHGATLAGVIDGDTTPRPDVHNGQSQIAYDMEEE